MATKGADRLHSKIAASKARSPMPRKAGQWDDLSMDEINRRTFESLETQVEGVSGGDRTVAHDTRAMYYKTLYDNIDARNVKKSPMQAYSVDEESVKALAEMIRTSGNTTPIIVRETSTPGEYELIDGERRTKAHLLLGRTVGEQWFMIPARVFRVGDLSDEDAEYMLHAENIGQRAMTPSERANGIRVITKRLIEERRKTGDKRPEGSLKEELARQLGISPRSAQADITISQGLSDAAMELYDEGGLTKVGAEAVARLDVQRQQEVVDKVRSGELDKGDIKEFVKTRKAPSKSPVKKDLDTLVKDAIRSLKKARDVAAQDGSRADRVKVAELKDLIDLIDPDRS